MRLSRGLHDAPFKLEPLYLEISLTTVEIRTNFSLAICVVKYVYESRFLYAGIYCTYKYLCSLYGALQNHLFFRKEDEACNNF